MDQRELGDSIIILCEQILLGGIVYSMELLLYSPF